MSNCNSQEERSGNQRDYFAFWKEGRKQTHGRRPRGKKQHREKPLLLPLLKFAVNYITSTEIQLILRRDKGQGTDASEFVYILYICQWTSMRHQHNPSHCPYCRRAWDGSFSNMTGLSVKPESADTESRRDGRWYQRLKKHSVRQSVSPSYFRASHQWHYQHLTSGSLKPSLLKQTFAFSSVQLNGHLQCTSYCHFLQQSPWKATSFELNKWTSAALTSVLRKQ